MMKKLNYIPYITSFEQDEGTGNTSHSIIISMTPYQYKGVKTRVDINFT